MIARVSYWVILGAMCLFASFGEAQTVSSEMSTPLPDEASRLRIGAPEYDGQHFQGRWQAETDLETVSMGKDQGFASHFGGRAQVNFKLAPMFALRATPGFSLYTARLQTRFQNEDYQNELVVDDSFLQFMPVKWWELRAGSLSQRYMDMPLLVSRDRAFPGAGTFFHVDANGKNRFDGVLQVTVPTSRSLNDERVAQEPLPVFETESVHYNAQLDEQFNMRAWAGHYRWQSLPAKIAYYSQMVGNEPSSELPGSAHFIHEFNGAFGGLSGCYCAKDGFGIEGSYTYFANFKAPADRGRGQMIEVSPYLDRPNWKLQLTASYFFNESDTTPAYYNPARYGHNNRQGVSGEVRFYFKKYQFDILGQGVVADTINFDPNQQSMFTALLGVETDYVSF